MEASGDKVERSEQNAVQITKDATEEKALVEDDVLLEEENPNETVGQPPVRSKQTADHSFQGSHSTSSSCPQQTRLIKALGSQLHLLADAIDALGEKKQNPKNKMDLAHRLEEATAVMVKGSSEKVQIEKEKTSDSDTLYGIQPSRVAAVGMLKEISTERIPKPKQMDGSSPPVFESVSRQVSDEENAPVLALILAEAPPTLTWEEQNSAKFKQRSSSFLKDLNHPEGWRTHVRNLLLRWWFEPLMGLVIVINAITIGIDSERDSQGLDRLLVMDVIEACFFLTYATDLTLRILAFGGGILLTKPWVQFDAVLVSIMVLDFLATLLQWGSLLSVFNVARLFRVARLARLMRSMGASFHFLSMFVQGLIDSVKTLIWIFVVICVLLYIFGILGMAVCKHDPDASAEYNDVVDIYFGDLWKTMLTMVLLGLTLDDIGVVYRGLVYEKPVLFLYFMSLLLVISIALLNLTMALMVEASLASAAHDAEELKAKEIEKKRLIIEDLAKVFRQLDTDGSGHVNKEELTSGPPEVFQYMCSVIGKEDPDEIIKIFDMLDYENQGELTIAEFCEGLSQIISGEPVELLCLLKQCKDIRGLLE